MKKRVCFGAGMTQRILPSLRSSLRFAVALMIAPLLFSLPVRAASDEGSEDASFSPKASVRFGNGLLMNAGAAGGSSLQLLSPNLSFEYFFGPKISLGLGYRFEFQFGDGNVPFHGFYVPIHFYWLGNGTKTRYRGSQTLKERHDQFGVYSGIELTKTFFFRGSNPEETTSELNGSFLGVNVSTGINYRISSAIELTAEANATAFTFATSDDRIKFRNFSILLGLNFLW